MSTVIRIENVSKLYRLGRIGTGTLSHDLNRWWHRIRGKDDPYATVGQVNDRARAQDPTSGQTQTAESDYVWALKDINLEVEQGEILGIIGRNGAGKSTLLKLLSRITAPTTGEIKARGRIASLLEVGTGFHPELTGRENIYLNGAILGMKYHEIASRLDEIVDFSGCSQYLDTPVKRYSSGMLVRLGFAVAAHLQCEILIVDEVLAVGDFEFQRKCISKMENVAESGRTILLVSHNMETISNLSTKALILEHGHKLASGLPTEMVARYCESPTTRASQFRGSIKSVTILDPKIDTEVYEYKVGDPVRVAVAFENPEIDKPVIGIGFDSVSGQRLLSVNSNQSEQRIEFAVDRNIIHCLIPNFPLPPGKYTVTVILNENNAIDIDVIREAATFRIVNAPFGADRFGFHAGVCVARSQWTRS